MTNRPPKIWDVPKRRFFINQTEPDMDIPDGDVMKGEKIYNTACTGCHALDDSNWMGPALRDCYNKRFATKKFPYSQVCMLVRESSGPEIGSFTF